MKRKSQHLPLLSSILLLPLISYADSNNNLLKCASIDNSIIRLECFDDIANKLQRGEDEKMKKELHAPDNNKDSSWETFVRSSKIDDSTTVTIVSEAEDSVPGPYGLSVTRPTLIVRCLENTTSVFINFNGLFMADIQGYGRVTFRKDNEKAFTKNLRASTDSKALGLWRGSTAIPFIKSLFMGKSLTIRATPYSEAPITFTVNITGLEEAIQPLRKSCNW